MRLLTKCCSYYNIRLLLLISLIAYTCGIVWFLFYKLNEIDIEDERIVEYSKCPFCYGKSFCDELQYGKSVHFSSNLIKNYFNVKNVFFAEKDNKKLVIKKLAHTDELKEFELKEKKCLKESSKSMCVSKLISFRGGTNMTKLQPVILGPQFLDIEIGHCFTERLIDRLYDKYKEFDKKYFEYSHIMLVTTLSINPEPIVLQLFPESEQWPFPEYIGACGRLIVEAYKGKTLDKYMNEPFKLRAKIALSLLQAVEMIYDNTIEFSVYLFDLGYENIAWDEEKEKVYFIDTENVLIVDKKQIKIDNPDDWDATYYISEFDECKNGLGDCVSFEPKSLCNNYHADFNYYTVCRNILSHYASDSFRSTNFLHSIPAKIDKEYNLNHLLDICAKYDGSYGVGRFNVAYKLKNTLNAILRSYEYKT